MKKMKGSHVAKSEWCDADLTGIIWIDNGRDLVLKWNTTNNSSRSLTCSWVSAIKIELISADNEGGYPLIWDAQFNQLPTGEWKLCFDFGSRGVIRLKCNEISLE